MLKKKLILNIFRNFITFFFILFLINNQCFGYEALIINFPEKEGWKNVYYYKTDRETIVQFVPRGETKEKWTRSVIFRSYKQDLNRTTPKRLKNNLLLGVKKINNSIKYVNYKNTEDDTITGWCVKKNKKMNGQCEILRTTFGHESMVSIHYIDKNINSTKKIDKKWLEILKYTRVYYSYYRMDRLLNREMIFEL